MRRRPQGEGAGGAGLLARAAERRLANAGRVKATRSVWNRSAGASSPFGSGDARSFIEKHQYVVGRAAMPAGEGDMGGHGSGGGGEGTGVGP